MSLTYAGIDLPVWTPKAAAWAEANIRPQDIFEFDVHHTRHLFTHLPLAAPPQLPPVRIGELVWPTGASRWGVFYAIVSCARLDDIRTACISGDGKYFTPQDLVLGDGHDGRLVTAADMTMLPARPLSGIPGELYLLPIVDKRYFWWRLPWAIADADLASWTALFTSFGIGLSTAIPSAYRTPDAARWKLPTQQKPVPLLMDAAANSVSRKVVLLLDGTVWAKTWDESRATHCAQFDPSAADERKVRAGGRAFSGDICRSAPAAVNIVFPPSSGEGTPTVVTKTLGANITDSGDAAYGCYGSGAGYGCDNAGGWYGSVGWDTCTGAVEGSYGCYGCYGYYGTTGTSGAWMSDYTGGDPTIQEILAGRAMVDYYGWFGADADIVWHGMIPAEPNGYADRISWTYRDNESFTRYQSPPSPNGSHLGGWSAGAASDSSFLALLTKKCYYFGTPGTEDLPCECLEDTGCNGEDGTPKRFVQYHWIAVTDAGEDPGPPCGVEFTYGPGSACGCPKNFPAYHPRNLDLAVFGIGVDTLCSGTEEGDETITLPTVAAHSIVRLRRGAGDYYIMEETHPWEDLWRRTGEFDDDGLEIAFLRIYDQNTGGWIDGEEGRLIPAG